MIEIDIKHLAAPNRLQPPKAVYVVWVESSQNGVQNLGQLRTSSGLITNTLKAEMEAVSPFKPTRFFITAEDEAGVQIPSSHVVLTTTSF